MKKIIILFLILNIYLFGAEKDKVEIFQNVVHLYIEEQIYTFDISNILYMRSDTKNEYFRLHFKDTNEYINFYNKDVYEELLKQFNNYLIKGKTS